MTPGARVAAAIEVLDAVLGGAPAEAALIGWARRSRFAGSADRRAVRDHVYTALRRRRSQAALGGAETGRGLLLGELRAAGILPESLMTGIGHAPPPPGPGEGGTPGDLPEAARLDMPDWLLARLVADHGDGAGAIAAALRDRAPVFLRVNTARAEREAVLAGLRAEGIGARPVDHVKTAIEVTENEQKVAGSKAFAAGLVELQDASSQAAVDALPLVPGMRVLDYCAGGGGKALAMAARGAQVVAHDAHSARMRDLPARAARAGVTIPTADAARLAGRRFDLVLVDAPCSGSGTWRRDPEGKWRLTPEGLDALARLQGEILAAAAAHVRPGGVLAYATCSVLRQENDARIDAFGAANPGWTVRERRAWLPGAGGDGFFLCAMQEGGAQP